MPFKVRVLKKEYGPGFSCSSIYRIECNYGADWKTHPEFDTYYTVEKNALSDAKRLLEITTSIPDDWVRIWQDEKEY